MKANESPLKLYISNNEKYFNEKCHSASTEKYVDDDIEYTRTDAFIEKALKWYCLDCECNDNCKDTKCFFHNEYKRFLEGNKNACPPKFECTILNPDGTTSDNWRYRHFTRKMQDAFIEKAFEFLDGCIPNYIDLEHANVDTFLNVDNKRFIENFRKYMKGE